GARDGRGERDESSTVEDAAVSGRLLAVDLGEVGLHPERLAARPEQRRVRGRSIEAFVQRRYARRDELDLRAIDRAPRAQVAQLDVVRVAPAAQDAHLVGDERERADDGGNEAGTAVDVGG